MSNMLNYPGAMNMLLSSPEEEISEAMWMKERWTYLSHTPVGLSIGLRDMVQGEALARQVLQIGWINCLSMYRAVGGLKAPYITADWVVQEGSDPSQAKLTLAFLLPCKKFTHAEQELIMHRKREILTAMEREVMP